MNATTAIGRARNGFLARRIAFWRGNGFAPVTASFAVAPLVSRQQHELKRNQGVLLQPWH
jgi:hypothetical protein